MMFELEGIDHVALTVDDLAVSAEWYQRVLGLKRRYEIWDPPIMLGAGTTAVALFPRRGVRTQTDAADVGFRHLAFRATRSNFELARSMLEREGVEYDFQDHDIAHSIYFSDPDGNQIEITTYDVGQ